MSHQVDMTRGRAAMAYMGETPWHGLGQKLSPGADLATWQAEAGMDWEAVKTPVLFDRTSIGVSGQMNVGIATDVDNCVLYRSDTGAPLSVVSSRYQLVQPKQIFEFFRDLTERDGFHMETAGSLKDGRQIWTLANSEAAMALPGNDLVKGYLLLATSFDGSMATQARFTSVRVVCNNTLTMATQGKADCSVRHSSVFSADDVKVHLKIGDAWRAFQASAEEMAKYSVSPKTFVELVMAAYFDLRTPAKVAAFLEDEKKKDATDKLVARVADAFANAPGQHLASARQTLWGAVNAVTFDVDHQYPARSRDNRLASAWFGKGETIKNRALEYAEAILDQG